MGGGGGLMFFASIDIWGNILLLQFTRKHLLIGFLDAMLQRKNRQRVKFDPEARAGYLAKIKEMFKVI